MIRFRYIIVLILFIVIPALAVSFGQTVSKGRDKYTLLTMPYNMRPLTLYRGQFQVNSGYKFAVWTLSYNSEGDKVFLKSKGTGSVYHYYFVDLKYGLTDFIEIGAETNFLRRGVRSESATFASTAVSTSDRISVNKLTEVKGMGDILLLTTVRPPMKYRWFDLSVTGGLFLPSSKYEPQKPTNSLVMTSTATNSFTVNYHYNYKNGYGVPVYLISASFKMSIKKFSAEAGWTFKTPVKEGKSIRWEVTLADKAFSYFDKSYQYLLSNTHAFNASLHYQATGWFDINLNGSFQKTKGGWTEYWGNKYINPETLIVTMEPGFELQISPKLTVYQVAGFPLKGKNSDAPFYLFTTIRFSNFLFIR
jgi:hypothetical protein